MANEKLLEVTEFKDLVRNIFGSQKAAEAALGLKAKTFSRLSMQQIPIYESQIEHYINNVNPIFTFSIKEYKDAREFAAYYGKDIKRWFKQRKELYKDKQIEFAERLYDLNDDSFINEFGDENSETITYIREEYYGYGIILRSWIKHLTIYELFKSNKNYFEYTLGKYDYMKYLRGKDFTTDNGGYIQLSLSTYCIFINVMFDCLYFSAICTRMHPLKDELRDYFIIKGNRENRFDYKEYIGLWKPIYIDQQFMFGFTYFIYKNTDTGLWETKSVCYTCYAQPHFILIDINSQNLLQQTCVSFNDNTKKYDLMCNSSRSFVSDIFPNGFYVIPKAECAISQYIDNVIWKNIKEDSLYVNEEKNKLLHNLNISETFDIESFFKGEMDIMSINK